MTDIISGTREIELELMSTRTYDPLVNIVGALQRAQYRYGTDDLEFAIERAEEVIRVRGRRLQLEGSGIPLLQFALLRVLSGLIVLTYTYLTLARRPRPIRTPSTRRYVGSMASPRAGPARGHGLRPRQGAALHRDASVEPRRHHGDARHHNAPRHGI